MPERARVRVRSPVPVNKAREREREKRPEWCSSVLYARRITRKRGKSAKADYLFLEDFLVTRVGW